MVRPSSRLHFKLLRKSLLDQLVPHAAAGGNTTVYAALHRNPSVERSPLSQAPATKIDTFPDALNSSKNSALHRELRVKNHLASTDATSPITRSDESDTQPLGTMHRSFSFPSFQVSDCATASLPKPAEFHKVSNRGLSVIVPQYRNSNEGERTDDVYQTLDALLQRLFYSAASGIGMTTLPTEVPLTHN